MKRLETYQFYSDRCNCGPGCSGPIVQWNLDRRWGLNLIEGRCENNKIANLARYQEEITYCAVRQLLKANSDYEETTKLILKEDAQYLKEKAK